MSDKTNANSPAGITEDDVRHVAKLSRLELDDAEVTEMTAQLGRVLDYIGKLSELDVENVEPMAHAMELYNVMDEDQPRQPYDVEQVLQNAPEKWDRFFKVPKVLGDGSGA